MKGFTPIHKCLVALRMLAYGGAIDSLDDPYKMAESTVFDTLIHPFCYNGDRVI
jgi:hypothetical protein